MARESVVNLMSIDVEDYFQVSAFDGVVGRHEWTTRESRVCANTERLLELFNATGVKATFFVLGWVAERFPELVRTLAQEGHEVASHSYGHRLVYDLTPQEFREDLRRARDIIETATGVPVRGFRAPSYSITRRSEWALDVLIEEGYSYDASIYPIHHDRYGIPDAPRHIHQIRRASGSIWELPGSTVRLGGTNVPVGGGGYFRLLPYWWTRWGIARLNAVEHHPAMFYLHPWEIDPTQPRIPAPRVSAFRHYTNLAKTEERLRALLADFRFAPASKIIDSYRQPLAEAATSALQSVSV